MILVDPIRRHQSGEWCHMVSDESVEELHEFAATIGLKRKSFQGASRPHYDLRPSKRRLALSMGAQEVGMRDLVRRALRSRSTP
jgi:Protein of unknown function (DUF4031)